MLNKRELAFQGYIISVYNEDWELPNGYQGSFEVVEHPGGIAIIAINNKRQICLVRQYRPIVGNWIWELPAGKRESDESALTTAQRELSEETGVTATFWQELGSIWSSPGIFKEQIQFFLAWDLQENEPALEEGELLEVHWWSWDEVKKHVYNGTLNDAKSLSALFKLQQIAEHLPIKLF